MKILYFLLILFIFNACVSGKKTSVAVVKINPEDTIDIKVDANDPKSNDINFFLKRFENAVLSHNPKRIMDFMDKAYKQEQHDSFLSNNTKRFLNEFFSGLDSSKMVYISVDYTKITGINRVDLKIENGYSRASYRIKFNGKSIMCDWVIITHFNKTRVEYGLFGPVG